MKEHLQILYEDNHLLAVNKPAGLLTQPTDEESESLETLAKAWIKEKYKKPGNVFLGVVHRLDRPVSGIVLFAKTSKALLRLNASIRAKEMEKAYYALVIGTAPKDEDTLEHFLKHGDYRASISKDKDAKLARLHYKVIKRTQDHSLLEVKLETGRYHQIRCQLAAAGCPIAGDTKYGAPPDSKLPHGTIGLHHIRLGCIHPITKAHLHLEAPLPSYYD